ncbi:DNA-binding response OmpR family regulator [Hydrogenoanaerobacterium saccharovorans]|uniref:Stage 0 sporulation protein A homolog n=1 Tax=Hydrogenoanaerobacterium saccharovorans TaxID=474960 RepID=A0A1H8BAA8_9FIRM|nr:response regulator transcription factor [Hydrogenoanaerobacterium saccharovorans]RPF47505.1 DNA-binding response OmpR family regulator [Hydrogenoanaerobacterium saccharovorans]SEM79901.1 DNA-binding response regulator, OmpR family, contains REC and winged-helix (wHTH) domain [Hydrogenoanaerobacterium saccharovorans]
MQKILIVDDDNAIAELMSDALEDEGFETAVCGNGEEALALLKSTANISLILLDVMMPKMDGLELCRRIRDTVTCPILFVTAKNRTLDTMLGLEMGGDDYIFKPFVVEELVARVKAHLRREKRTMLSDTNDSLAFGGIELKKDSLEAFRNGEAVALSPREFRLLYYFIKNAGKVLTREQIFNGVWGVDYGDIGTVAVNIKNLRDKIDPDNEYIKTVWGVGYKLVKPSGDVR